MRLMRSSFLLIFVIVLLSNSLFSQQYTWPESVVYDVVNDRYLISNTGSGDIIAVPRTDPTNMSTFVLGTNSGWVSMKGIVIIGNTIWCACTFDASVGYKEALIGRDLNTGAITHTIDFPSGDFINDVTADASGIIYLSGNSVIYQVDPNTAPATITTLLTNTNAYNGLYFDDANNRLLYTDDYSVGVAARISAMDMSDNSTSVLFASPAGVNLCDGLTMDHLGNIYYSVWSSPNQVMRYNPNTGIVDVASIGHNGITHSGAADIYYHDLSGLPKTKNAMSSVGTLVVPNFGPDPNGLAPVWGWVDFIPFDQLSTNENEISIPTEFQLHQNFPNPFNPNTTIFYDVSRESNVKVIVFDLLGREIVKLVDKIEPIGSRTVNWDGRDYTGNLVNAGVYIYQIEADAFIQTKKMVLLK
jgi:sugar lactone lactonase YvrE